MASNLRVDTILPSSGTNVAIGTASGTVSLVGNSNLTTTGNLTIGGNLGIGGTLTYEDVTNIDSVGIITARAAVSIADSIVHTGDTNTSLRFPAADTITAETSGLERLRIDSSGRLLLGTTTEGSTEADDLTIATSGHTGITLRSGTTHEGNIFFSDGTSGADEYRGLIRYDHDGDKMIFGTGDGTERLRIGSAGQIGIAGANYGTSGQVLTSQGTSSAPTWASASAAAGSVYDTFHGQGFSSQSGNGYYTSGWGKPGGPGGSWANGPSGKLITESSGIFSFPSTGIYYISHRLQFSGQNINMRIGGNRIYGTNSNANPPAHQLAEGQCNINSFSGTSNGYGWAAAFCECIIKITNTSNDKVAFWWQSSEASNIGSGVGNMVVFFKIADLN